MTARQRSLLEQHPGLAATESGPMEPFESSEEKETGEMGWVQLGTTRKDPPFLMGKSTISMVIFNSYVKLLAFEWVQLWCNLHVCWDIILTLVLRATFLVELHRG